MIATVFALGDRQTPEFAGPEHDGVVEQPTGLEVLDQCGTGLVGHGTEALEPLSVFVVGVPRLAAQEQLHEPHAPLDQTPGDEAPPPVFSGHRVVEAVEPSRGCRFPRQVHHLGHGGLHAGGGLELGQPCLPFRIGRIALGLMPVQTSDEVQLMTPRLGGNAGRGLQMKHRSFATAEGSSLIQRRKESGGPIPLTIDREASGIGQHHIRGQILILRTQTIQHPGTHRGQPCQKPPRMHDAQRRFVVHRPRGHGAN